MLRTAREAQKLTLQQVSEITKIRADHLRALEEGNFAIFNAEVYVKGFVKTYAKLLKLDIDQVTNALNEELAQVQKFQERKAFDKKEKGVMDTFTLILSQVPWQIVLPALVVITVLFLSVQAYRAYHSYKSKPVTIANTSIMYKPHPEQFDLYLPIPTNFPVK